MAEKKTSNSNKKVSLEEIQGNKDNQAIIAEEFGYSDAASKEMIKMIKQQGIGVKEMRFLVDMFYQTQAKRIIYQGQVRSIIQEADESLDANHEVLSWGFNNMYSMERSLFKVLDAATSTTQVGLWLKANMGIGPTLAAALMAYFDINKASAATHFWSYAGLNDNNCKRIGREKADAIVKQAIKDNNGKLDSKLIMMLVKSTKRKAEFLTDYGYVKDKNGDYKHFKDGYHLSSENLAKAIALIPYNADLKTICWKVGQQFAKLINNPKSKYGRLLAEKKYLEEMRNERGDFADQAAASLKEKNYGKDTDAYKAYIQGKLPAARLQMRAERYAVKIFVSHLFEAMYMDKYHAQPPKFYAMVYLEHNDYITPEVPFEEYFTINE